MTIVTPTGVPYGSRGFVAGGLPSARGDRGTALRLHSRGLCAGPLNTPESYADLAQKLLPAVVNISTTQNIPERRGAGPRPGPEMPQFPPGSPFEEFFRDFFDRQGREQNAPPRRATSLGSGSSSTPVV